MTGLGLSTYDMIAPHAYEPDKHGYACRVCQTPNSNLLHAVTTVTLLVQVAPGPARGISESRLGGAVLRTRPYPSGPPAGGSV